MGDPRELPGSDGYLEALACYLRQPGLCWHAWVVLYPDGSYYVPEANVPYSPMPWEPEGGLVLHRPTPQRGVRVQEQWRAELDGWLTTPF